MTKYLNTVNSIQYIEGGFVMIIVGFIIVFWVMTRTGLRALMPKKNISVLILSSAAALYLPSV